MLSFSAVNMDANDYTHFRLLHALSTQHKMALTTFNLISSLMNVFSNAFLLYTVRKLKLGTSISYRFIIALAISELLVGGTAQPLFSVVYADTFTNKSYARIIYVVVEVAAILPCQFSALMILLISLDRYLHMKHLTLYNIHMTRRRGNILIFCNVVACTLLGILFILASLYGFYIPVLLGFIVTNVIVFNIFMSYYIKAYLSVRKRVAAMGVINSTSQNISRADLQFAKGILIIMASVTIRYIPYYVVATLANADTNKPYGLIFAYYWSIQVVFLGIFINVLILFGLNRKLRNFAASRIRCQMPTEEE